jgi:tetratricopeptide (TPR) repeat protein
MTKWRATIAVAMAVALFTPWVAEAQADRDGDARQLFEAAQLLYDDGEFEQAGRMFERAYELSNRTSLLYNAYLAYRDGQMQVDAARVLRQYLDLPDAQDRDRLTPRLEALERANAEAASAPTQEPGAADTQTSAVGTEAPEDTTESSSSPNVVGPLLVGAGGAMLAVGAVMGVLANKDADTLSDRCENFVCSADDRSLHDRSQRRGNASTALLIGGGVSAVAGVVLWIVMGRGDDDAEPARARFDLGCDGQGCAAAVRGTF